MAKISRHKLPRGVKLTINHTISGPLKDIETQLRGEVDTNNLKENKAPFRLNFNVPMLKCIAPEADDSTDYKWKGAAMIPFVLPPTQDFFNQELELTKTTPIPILDEFSFSIDQRGEAASIIGPDPYNNLSGVNESLSKEEFGGSGSWEGSLNFDSVGSNYGLDFIIIEKQMTLAGGPSNHALTQEVFSLSMPGTAFISKTEKLTPFAITDIAKPLNPYKSYVLIINPTSNYIPRAFVSIQVSLKFRMELLNRDVQVTNTVQNCPTNHSNAVQDAAAIGITVPAGDSTIQAESNDGLQTNIELVDEVFVNKLHGGMNEWSDVPFAEHIDTSAAYEIIAVPLFSNKPTVIMGKRDVTESSGEKNYVGNWMDWLPYLANTDAGGDNIYPTFSRRIIPLVNSMTIHHVVIAAHVPTNFWSLYTTQLGVGIGTGMVGDSKGYQQIAMLSHTALSEDFKQIDYCNGFNNATYYDKDTVDDAASPKVDGYFATHAAETTLLNAALVHPSSGTDWVGTTYKTTEPDGTVVDRTGVPIFVGKSYSQTQARSNISSGQTTTDGRYDGAGTMGASAITGQEQWLEVRFKIQPPSDEWNDTAVPISDRTGQPVFFPGAFWVYIIGKKHLTKVDI